MSSVSSVTDQTQGLAQFLQRMSQQQGTQSAAANGATSASDADGSQQVEHHRRHSGGGGAVKAKIESAVSDALKNYDGTGDVHQVIQDAIKGAIQSGTQSGSQSGTQAPASTSDASQADSSQQQQASFESLLQSHGIDAASFRDDMMAAFQSVHGKTSDSTSAVHGLTQGSHVDVDG
jgi:hypothetical protein